MPFDIRLKLIPRPPSLNVMSLSSGTPPHHPGSPPSQNLAGPAQEPWPYNKQFNRQYNRQYNRQLYENTDIIKM